MRPEPVGRPAVLHVLEAVGGGTAKHLLDLVRHVDGVDHLAVVPARRMGGLSDDNIVPRLREAGAEVRVVPMQRLPIGPRNAVAVMRLRRMIAELAPDVVHAHASIGGALAQLAIAGTGRRLLWTPHAINSGRVYAAAERMLFGNATIIALSDSERDLIRDLRVGDLDRVHVIPNGVAPQPPADGLYLRKNFGIPASAPVIGTVARLVAQKAPLDFVHACARIAEHRPDARFVLVGEGPLGTEVDKEVARLGLVGRFHRLRCPSDAATVVGQFSVFLLSSRYEGAPYTPLEAMVSGVPVCVTGCVGTRDTVEHERNGLVVEPGDTEALGDAALRVLSDELLRLRLIRAATESITARFHIDVMAQRYTDLYRELSGRVAVPAARVPDALGGFRPGAVLAGSPWVPAADGLTPRQP